MDLGALRTVVLGPDVDAAIREAHLEPDSWRRALADAEGLKDKGTLEPSAHVYDAVLMQRLFVHLNYISRERQFPIIIPKNQNYNPSQIPIPPSTP